MMERVSLGAADQDDGFGLAAAMPAILRDAPDAEPAQGIRWRGDWSAPRHRRSTAVYCDGPPYSVYWLLVCQY